MRNFIHAQQGLFAIPNCQVVDAVFANEEFADAAMLGLKAKYPGICKKVNLKSHPSSGLYTLSFIDSERLRSDFEGKTFM